MRRADRLFRIVQRLRGRQVVTAQTLAEELSISTRTVYRDIRDLVQSGVPIRGEAGVGYALERGYQMPPVTFNTAELEALVLGIRMVQAWGDRELAEAAGSALDRVEAGLPQTLRRVLLETALFGPPMRLGEAISEQLVALRRAVAERRLLRFAYQDAEGAATERTVRPLGLYFWGFRWTLAAWCTLRRDYRNFRPDRMAQLTLLEPWPAAAPGASAPSLQGFEEAMRCREEARKRDAQGV